MKKFIALLFVLVSINSYAQTLDVAYKSYGSDNYYTMTVIKPTVMNFIILLSLDEASFVSVMKKYKYFEEDNGGKYRTFGNGSLDNYAYAHCANSYSYSMTRDEIRFFVAKEMIYPSTAMTDLYRELRPYYKDSKPNEQGGSIDLYMFNYGNSSYSFFITIYPKYYDVTVVKDWQN